MSSSLLSHDMIHDKSNGQEKKISYTTTSTTSTTTLNTTTINTQTKRNTTTTTTSSSSRKKTSKKNAKQYLQNQRLQRDRVRFTIESKQLDINALRQEILHLKTTKELLKSKRFLYTRTNLAIRIVQEYMDLFQNGFLLDYSYTSCSNSKRQVTRHIQEHFLRNCMENSLDYGVGRGLESFISFWHQFMLCHDRLFQFKSAFFSQVVGELELEEEEEVEQKEEDTLFKQANPMIVKCQVFLRVRITRKTLVLFYPHALSQEFLTQKLIGRIIEYPCDFQFVFNQQNHIQGFYVHIEHVYALSTIFHRLEDIQLTLQAKEDTNRRSYPINPLQLDFIEAKEDKEDKEETKEDNSINSRRGTTPQNSNTKSSLTFILND